MNNHHDIVYVTQDDLDINQFRLLKFNPNVGFVETKIDLKALKDVFVFTKEQLEKFSEIVIADYIDYGEPKKESIGRTINRMQK